MKAVRIHAPGGPEVLKYEDVPEPQPKAGEAVVKVDAAGLNYIDGYYRSGQYKAQLPMTLGARVIGTVSTEAKAKLAREAGADEVILYTTQDFEAEGKRLTSGRGVQVVYDSVGKTTFEKGISCLAPRGLMALYGQSSGPIGTFDPQVLNQKGSLFLTRPSLVHHVATREELLQRAGEARGWIRDGKLRLRTEFEFPLKDAAEAHRALEGRKTTGKVLLIP